MKSINHIPIGELVTENFNYAPLFQSLGIDFCCHGHHTLQEACDRANQDIEAVKQKMTEIAADKKASIFHEWPLDLLIDYVLKIHHRNIREHGPETLNLLCKVANVHAENHPELMELVTLFEQSLNDLYEHLDKEEQVLFPFLYELFDASRQGRSIAPFHCGSIEFPIGVMMMEHEQEGERYFRIKALTHDYEIPQDACASYQLVMKQMQKFMTALFEHIHIENNIIFPRFQALERQFVI